MNTSDAKELIIKVLSHSYNEQNFRELIHNLFNSYEMLEEGASSGTYIPALFKEHIRSYKRLAKYENKGKTLDVLAVCVNSENKLEHARTMQRNFVSHYLNGSRGGKLKDAALVAFYSPNISDWRLSLVKMDYRYDEEKNRIITDFTPAKRYSFLVGENEQIHTACKQMLPLLINDENPTLFELEDAFNIERVSNEFFEKYKELFLRLVEAVENVRSKNNVVDFTLRSLNTAHFCKKLLGQIVFLYFLQKKGWLGVNKGNHWGTGDKRFLRSIFQRAINENKNYFNDYLEYLFYEGLAVERKDNYFKNFDCKIPFLNGGLFEPVLDYNWQECDILIPNELFSNDTRTPEGDVGDGILDIFDRYNFTVREDEALEKEVAVDPEMLGKVFENLLEINDRKSKGAFYTPREIVHYMCQESLIDFLYNKLNYVKTSIIEEKQKSFFNITKKQPELVKEEFQERISKEDLANFIHYGDLLRENEKIVENQEKSSYVTKMPVAIKTYATEIDEALENIFICDPAIGSGAFPVGMMNEIVRARLTLLESGYIKDRCIRNAYVYKRQAIQKSIYGTDIDSGAVEIAKLRFWLSLVVDEESTDEIKPLPNLDYKIMCANSLLEIGMGNLFSATNLRHLEQLKEQFYNETNKSNKRTLKNNIDAILKCFANEGEFDFNIFFSEVFHKNKGFDIVIGNPPYVQLQKFKGTPFQALYKSQNFKVYEAKGDLYCLFYERGIQLLKEKGILCYITSNKWMRAGYGEALRSFFLKCNPTLLIDLGANVFSSATVDTNILLVEKKGYDKKTLSCTLLDRQQEMSVFVRQNAIEMEYTKDAWAILNPIEQSIKAKIEKYGTPLKKWDISINYGIKTGCNEAFIITGEKRKELIAEDPKSDEIIRPILRGRDIKRYGYEFADLWLIATFPSKHYNIDDYPAVKKWLINGDWVLTKTKGNPPTPIGSGKLRLEQTGLTYEYKGVAFKSRKKTNNKWFETQDSIAYWNDFSRQKIMYSEIVRSPQFYLDNDGVFYPEATSFIMTGKYLEYLLLAVHSKLLTYAFKTFYAGGGLGENGYRYKKAFLENLPIYKINEDELVKCKNWLHNQEYDKIDTFLNNVYKITSDEFEFIKNFV